MRMQPGVTVVLATVWLVVSVGVVGAATLHPHTHLTLDQYSPLPPYRHGVYRRVEGQLDWKDQNPAENQPFDLSIGPRRSISPNESSRRTFEVKYPGRDLILSRTGKHAPADNDFSSLGQDKQSRNFAGSKFAGERSGYKSTKEPESFSREIPPSELEDPFVADDTFQDQGPGSVEIYKLDLFKEKTLLNPNPTTKPFAKSKSKTPKKTSHVNWKAKTIEYKTTSPQIHHKQSNSFDESRTEVPASSESFGTGGVPELQVGCEGLEASHKLKRSIEAPGREKDAEVDPWMGVTPISLDLDYELSSEEAYEEMDELVKLKRLETTTKRIKQNRGDMEATLHSDEFDSDKRTSEKLPVRGDLGKLSTVNQSAVQLPASVGEEEKTGRKARLVEGYGESLHGEKQDRGDDSSSVGGTVTGNQGRKLLWIDDLDAEDRLQRSKRAVWGFGEDEGVVSSDELETENERRRQEYERRHKEARRRGSSENRTSSEINNIREEYERALEKAQREIEERERRIQEEEQRRRGQEKYGTREKQLEEERRRSEEEELRRRNRWQEEERRRQELEAFRRNYDRRPGNRTEEEMRRQRMNEEEMRRQRTNEEEVRRQRTKEEEMRRHRMNEEEMRRHRMNEEDMRRLRMNEEEMRRQRTNEEEMRRQRTNEGDMKRQRMNEEEMRRQRANEGDMKRQRMNEEEMRRREESRLREEKARIREDEEEGRRRVQEAEMQRREQNRRREEMQRKRQQEEDRRRLEQRQREWATKRRQEEEEEERRRQGGNKNEPPSNLLYPFRSSPNETRRYETEADRRLREQQERERDRKLREYIERNRPIVVGKYSDRRREEMERRRMEEERRRYRPEDRTRPNQTAARGREDEEQDRRRVEEQRRRMEEQRKKMEEERKLQEYIRRNQPVHVPSTNDSYDRYWAEYERRLEDARQNNRSTYPGPETGRRTHGPSAPTNIDPRSYVDESRRRQEARRLEEESRMRERERHAEEERRKEILRREEEARRMQSRRYEEERRRLEAVRLEAERRAKELVEEQARRSQAGRTRPSENTRPEYEDRRRFEEHRRRQDSSSVPANLATDQSRRAMERERQRQEQERRRLEAERRRQGEGRMNGARQDEEQRARAAKEQWRRREEARLNALPVSARIIVRPGAASPFSKPTLTSRTGFANEIDFTGINPSRPGVQAPRFPASVTSRPPAKSPGPCVWAVVHCCPTNVNRLVTCFESMGCPGVNWDPNPCKGSVAQAARDEVMKFYAATEMDDHLQ